MRLSHTNNYTSVSSEPAPGLLTRLSRLLWRGTPKRDPVLVKVWDARRGHYREVDLLNHEDPLWSTAKSLAGMQDGLRKTAA